VLALVCAGAVCASAHPVTLIRASDLNLTVRAVGDQRLWLNAGDAWQKSSDLTLGGVRPVALKTVLTESQQLHFKGMPI
jgi:hypothetical protein